MYIENILIFTILGRKPIDVCYSSDIAKLVRPRQFHSHLQKSISAISITATDKCKLFNSINEDIDCFERVQLFLQVSLCIVGGL